MYCSNCGKEIPDATNFCCHCGKQLGKKDTDKSVFMNLADKPRKKTGCGKIGCGALVCLFGIGFIASINGTPSEDKKDTTTQSDVNETQSEPEPAKPEPEKKVHKAPISPSAIHKYPESASELKKQGFPKMLKKYGVEGVKKINKLLPKAAEKAALNRTMDKIVYADVSDNRSTKEQLVFYVDAENRNRLYISESDLMSDKPALSNQEILRKLLPTHERMCENLIKAQLTYPSTYDKSIFDSRSETQEYTNAIRIAFSAKNAYGLEIDYVAFFRVNANSEVVYKEIEEKQ